MPTTSRPITCTFSKRRCALTFAALLVLLLLTACSRQQQPDTGPYNIELLPPEPAANQLSVRLTDESRQPITDAQISLEGNMNHAGMLPVVAGPVEDAVDGSTDGVYQVPFEFTMFGDWIVTVTAIVDVASGDTVSRDFDLSVNAGGATLSEP